MPVTSLRGKVSESAAAKNDPASNPSSNEKADSKTASSKSSGSGKTSGTGESGKSSTDKTARSTDSPKPDTTARQRARERRRGKVEISPEPASPSPDTGASGRIKNLAGFWSTPKEEAQTVRKKRLEIAESKGDTRSDEDSSSDESDEFDGIKRAQETTSTADREELIEIEKGRAKSIASMWQNRKEEDTTSSKKTPFKLDIKSEEPTVFENEPVVLEGVVRSDDRTSRDDIVVRRPGRIRDLAVNFNNIGSKPRSDESDDDVDDDAAQKNSPSKKEEIIERGKIQNVRERWKKRQQKSSGKGKKKASDSDADESSRDSSSAEESGPQQRSSKTKSDQIIEQAKIKNLREKWIRRQGGSQDKDEASHSKPVAPARLHALDTAKEHGVFENEPVVREDVVRADDEQPDIISSERTKKLRRMWTMMEKETTKDKDTKPVELNIRSKKKEEKPEPEPEPPKPSTPKTQKGVAGRYQVQKDATKSKDDGKSTESGKKDSKEGGIGKLQRSFTVATGPENSSNPSAGQSSGSKSPSLARYSSRKKNA